MELSEWIVVDEYCATRVLKGTDPTIIANRFAFIEKTPRVRIAEYSDLDDFLNWEQGTKGSDYGFDEESRQWCDDKLTSMGFILN